MNDSVSGENSSVMPPHKPRYSFFGSYSHSIDAKGRIIIPTPYRDALGDLFSIGPTRDFFGVALYPDDVFDSIIDELNGLNQSNPAVQKYIMQFFKMSYRSMQADGQGRLLLPTNLRQRFLKDSGKLEISGIYNHVRIVDEERATAADEEFMAQKDEILEELSKEEAERLAKP